ncbi:unnamed protein product [Urochloa humidicola]
MPPDRPSSPLLPILLGQPWIRRQPSTHASSSRSHVASSPSSSTITLGRNGALFLPLLTLTATIAAALLLGNALSIQPLVAAVLLDADAISRDYPTMVSLHRSPNPSSEAPLWRRHSSGGGGGGRLGRLGGWRLRRHRRHCRVCRFAAGAFG